MGRGRRAGERWVLGAGCWGSVRGGSVGVGVGGSWLVLSDGVGSVLCGCSLLSCSRTSQARTRTRTRMRSSVYIRTSSAVHSTSTVHTAVVSSSVAISPCPCTANVQGMHAVVDTTHVFPAPALSSLSRPRSRIHCRHVLVCTLCVICSLLSVAYVQVPCSLPHVLRSCRCRIALSSCLIALVPHRSTSQAICRPARSPWPLGNAQSLSSTLCSIATKQHTYHIRGHTGIIPHRRAGGPSPDTTVSPWQPEPSALAMYALYAHEDMSRLRSQLRVPGPQIYEYTVTPSAKMGIRRARLESPYPHGHKTVLVVFTEALPLKDRSASLRGQKRPDPRRGAPEPSIDTVLVQVRHRQRDGACVRNDNIDEQWIDMVRSARQPTPSTSVAARRPCRTLHATMKDHDRMPAHARPDKTYPCSTNPLRPSTWAATGVGFTGVQISTARATVRRRICSGNTYILIVSRFSRLAARSASPDVGLQAARDCRSSSHTQPAWHGCIAFSNTEQDRNSYFTGNIFARTEASLAPAAGSQRTGCGRAHTKAPWHIHIGVVCAIRTGRTDSEYTVTSESETDTRIARTEASPASVRGAGSHRRCPVESTLDSRLSISMATHKTRTRRTMHDIHLAQCTWQRECGQSSGGVAVTSTVNVWC
ncbi:hypothetical protein OH76DRAFT_656216 [Lentinus brumalis]|uniref:Uncharacterized protein n=1 Tax=Lentinus brumalis TaxID=2498619 RepID=A0A371D7G1_9APHY|nr:hypothetical protein OH76DRAFT_656216 [Polyporus brumalis]